MPRGKKKIVSTKSKSISRTASKTKRNKDNIDLDIETDIESNVGDIENKKNQYDATLHDNGDDIEGETDERDADEWEGDDMDDVEAEDVGDEEDVDNAADEDIENIDEGREGDEECAYNATRKSKGVKKLGQMIDKEDDDDDDGADFNADENELNSELYVKPNDRRTANRLFLYEKVRILGDRTAQIAQGAKPMIKGVEGMDPRTITQLELESKMIPIKIIRPLPNGMKEKWSLKELHLKKKYIIYGFTDGEKSVDKNIIDKIKTEYQKGGSIIGYSHLVHQNESENNTKIESDTSTNTLTDTSIKSKSTKSKNKSNSKTKTITKTITKTEPKKIKIKKN